MKNLLTSVLAASFLLTATPVMAEDHAAIKEAYKKNCMKCHGFDGAAKTKMGEKKTIQNFTDAKWQAAVKDEDLTKAVTDGYTDPKDPKRKMPGYSKKVSADEVISLVALIRGFGKGFKYDDLAKAPAGDAGGEE